MVIWVLLVWGIGFGVTGLGTCPCDGGGLGLLSGAMLETCGLLSYPNLRTGSWSDHPFKQYNHEPIIRHGLS
jgi:hypothetical protein